MYVLVNAAITSIICYGPHRKLDDKSSGFRLSEVDLLTTAREVILMVSDWLCLDGISLYSLI